MRRNIAGVILLVLAAVAAVGSVTFLGPCVHEDGSAGPCAKAGTAVLIAGCVLAVLAVLILAFRGRGIRTVHCGSSRFRDRDPAAGNPVSPVQNGYDALPRCDAAGDDRPVRGGAGRIRGGTSGREKAEREC